jgi:hypothetical protein
MAAINLVDMETSLAELLAGPLERHSTPWPRECKDFS